MNRRLRTRHRRMLGGLALLLPVGIGIALSSRPSYTLEAASSVEGAGLAARLGVALDASDLWGETELHCRVWPAKNGEDAVVELLGEEDLALPDVLLYWSPETSDDGGLGSGAYLLGSFHGTQVQRFNLPAAASLDGLDGILMLYSLAHSQVVDRASLAGLGD